MDKRGQIKMCFTVYLSSQTDKESSAHAQYKSAWHLLTCLILM